MPLFQQNILVIIYASIFFFALECVLFKFYLRSPCLCQVAQIFSSLNVKSSPHTRGPLRAWPFALGSSSPYLTFKVEGCTKGPFLLHKRTFLFWVTREALFKCGVFLNKKEQDQMQNSRKCQGNDSRKDGWDMLGQQGDGIWGGTCRFGDQRV